MRELENLIKRAVILGTDESIRRELAEAIAGARRGRSDPGAQTKEPAMPALSSLPVSSGGLGDTGRPDPGAMFRSDR